MSLTEEVKRYAKESLGARMIGIASVDRFGEAPRGHRPEDFLPGARSVIVVALPLLKGLTAWRGMLAQSELIPPIRRLPSGDTVEPRLAIANHIYGRCCYESINNELQRIVMHTAFMLEEAGYDSIYMPVTYGSTFHPVPNDVNGLIGPFSHRHAAVAAGLGELGISNLLLTEKFGARQRLGSVFTTAPLEPDPVREPSLCKGEECLACVEACPMHVFGKRKPFQMLGKKMSLAEMFKGNCVGARVECGGACMDVCPVGQKAGRL